MKVDSDLRAAIKSAEKIQRERDTWQARNKRNEQAVQLLLKSKPKLARAIKHANSEITRLLALIQKHTLVLDAAGLQRNSDKDHPLRIYNEEVFTKAGGVIIDSPTVWSADRIIAQLASAEAKDAGAILARIGIKWS